MVYVLAFCPYCPSSNVTPGLNFKEIFLLDKCFDKKDKMGARGEWDGNMTR